MNSYPEYKLVTIKHNGMCFINYELTGNYFLLIDRVVYKVDSKFEYKGYKIDSLEFFADMFSHLCLCEEERWVSYFSYKKYRVLSFFTKHYKKVKAWIRK